MAFPEAGRTACTTRTIQGRRRRATTTTTRGEWSDKFSRKPDVPFGAIRIRETGTNTYSLLSEAHLLTAVPVVSVLEEALVCGLCGDLDSNAQGRKEGRNEGRCINKYRQELSAGTRKNSLMTLGAG